MMQHSKEFHLKLILLTIICFIGHIERTSYRAFHSNTFGCKIERLWQNHDHKLRFTNIPLTELLRNTSNKPHELLSHRNNPKPSVKPTLRTSIPNKGPLKLENNTYFSRTVSASPWSSECSSSINPVDSSPPLLRHLTPYESSSPIGPFTLARFLFSKYKMATFYLPFSPRETLQRIEQENRALTVSVATWCNQFELREWYRITKRVKRTGITVSRLIVVVECEGNVLPCVLLFIIKWIVVVCVCAYIMHRTHTSAGVERSNDVHEVLSLITRFASAPAARALVVR